MITSHRFSKWGDYLRACSGLFQCSCLVNNLCKYFIHRNNLHVQLYYLVSLETSRTIFLILDQEEISRKGATIVVFANEGALNIALE